MNYNLPFIPERSKKPRNTGINMIMDKGMSVKDTENFISSCAELVDFVKFGFGTSLVTKNLKEKIALYKSADIKPYFGGTLFEAFIIRDMYDDFVKYIEKYDVNVLEVSDGEIIIPHDKKCRYIETLSKNFTVFSEVGSKEAGVIISNEKWVQMMKDELNAGSFKVIAEARESGTIGIYNKDGSANTELINAISENVSNDNILWEAPIKSQQAWFIKNMGHNVNLGNIAPNEVIPLETLRLGLRGDTFFQYLPDELKKLQQI